MKIALCPGHHRDAKGAVNLKHGLNEHDEAKKVVLHLSQRLQQSGHDVSVFTGHLTHKINCINNGGFDLALDIHFNAGGGHGCEVVYVPHSPTRHAQASVMASTICAYMGSRNRGAKEGYWMGGEHPGTKPDAFVSETMCPAFIPEQLFIDNDAEVEKWLLSGRHDQLAEAIAIGIGIDDAFGSIKRRVS